MDDQMGDASEAEATASAGRGYSFDQPSASVVPNERLRAAINEALAPFGLVLTIGDDADPVVITADLHNTDLIALAAHDAANETLIAINDTLAAEGLSVARGQMVDQPTRYWLVRLPKVVMGTETNTDATDVAAPSVADAVAAPILAPPESR